MAGKQDVERGGEESRAPLLAAANEDRFMVYLSTFVAVSGSYAFGSCIGYSSPTQFAIRRDINLSLAEYALFGSILNFGAIIGAITCGQMADKVGRKGSLLHLKCKQAMIVSSGFCTMGWLSIYIAEDALLLDIGRLATGYGMGVFSYVVPVFISEIAPKDLRGTLTTLHQLMIVTGVSVSFVVGTLVTWRDLALVGIVPCAALLVDYYDWEDHNMMEYVKARQGKQREFEASLRRLRGKNADVSEEAAEIQDNIETLEMLPKARLLDLFQRRYQSSLMIAVGLMVFQQLGGINGVSFYTSSIFEAAGFPSDVGTVIYAVLQVIITAVAATFMDKAGRKPLLVISGSGLILGSLLIGSSFYVKEHGLASDAAPALALSGVMVYIGSFSVGMGAIPWVVMSEIFPLNIKGTAGSFATLVNWSGSWACSYTFNFLMSWSTYGSFMLYAAVNALAVLFVIKICQQSIEFHFLCKVSSCKYIWRQPQILISKFLVKKKAMAGKQDVERGENCEGEEIRAPLIAAAKEEKHSKKDDRCMVYLSTFVAVCGSYAFGSCAGYSSPTQFAIREDVDLSLAEVAHCLHSANLIDTSFLALLLIQMLQTKMSEFHYSLFGSILTFGAMIGAITSGKIADYIGRKGAMIVSSGFCAAGWLSIYFAESALLLDIGRLATGYGMGVFSYVVPVFIAEIAPKDLRGALTTINQFCILHHRHIVDMESSSISRSQHHPRAKQGKQKEFESSLRRLRGKDADVSAEAAEIQDYIETLERLPKAKQLDLFQKRYLRSVTIGVGLMVCQQFGGINGVCFYTSSIFKSAGFPADLGTIIYAILQVIITALGAAFIDRAGRKPLLVISGSGLVLGCLLTGSSFFVKEYGIAPGAAPALAVSGILVYIGAFSAGMGAVPWVVMSEEHRADFSTLVNWFGAWACSYTLNFLMSWSSYGTFILYGSVNALAIVFVIKVVPETKGRTLEQIQAAINSS
ncbi:hypothetical protein SASPL_122762 [Salvia splendens]|uniref:Major facilitator superfamily (MFS) profile domain-containing protein n=1 Tax=Salvia splendens TaxID=180675 RepID=A0A8X8XPX2_SALSN|nr:hypothetical protein SASPL_122762 [Salvia splendens]